MDAKKLNNDGVCLLIEATIVQAAKDYMKLLRRKWKLMVYGINYTGEYIKICQEINTLEDFFTNMGAIGIRDECYRSAQKSFNERQKELHSVYQR